MEKSEHFSFKKAQYILILGGSGGIGEALLKKLKRLAPEAQLIASIRNKECEKIAGVHYLTLIADNEQSWQQFTKNLQKITTRLDAIISTIGVLHNDSLSPEKSLREINFEQMKEVFLINALTAPMAAKHLQVFLSNSSPSLFAFLSAKVGSISDNRLGGWYSYRASKAALNMFVKTMAIELERKRYPTSVIAIHPGTTKTQLSKPFVKNFKLQLWETDQTADHLLNVLEKSYQEGSGLFKNWDGQNLSW